MGLLHKISCALPGAKSRTGSPLNLAGRLHGPPTRTDAPPRAQRRRTPGFKADEAAAGAGPRTDQRIAPWREKLRGYGTTRRRARVMAHDMRKTRVNTPMASRACARMKSARPPIVAPGAIRHDHFANSDFIGRESSARVVHAGKCLCMAKDAQ